MVTNLSAGEELVRYARQHKIEEIFIGVRKKSKIGKLVFGSTAQYVILSVIGMMLIVCSGLYIFGRKKVWQKNENG